MTRSMEQMEERLRDLADREVHQRQLLDSDLHAEQEKVRDLEERLDCEMQKHLSFKAQLQDKVNALRMEVSQRQKEFSESQKISNVKNKALIRDNNRLKDEVAMLR